MFSVNYARLEVSTVAFTFFYIVEYKFSVFYSMCVLPSQWMKCKTKKVIH